MQVPTSFAMFTDKGNKVLSSIAQNLADAVSKTTTEKKVVSAVKSYFESYSKVCDLEGMLEAADTEVRECVFCFAEEVAEEHGVGRGVVEDVFQDAVWGD